MNIINIPSEILAGSAFIETLPKVLRHQLIGSATYMLDASDVDFAVLIEPAENAMNYLGTLCDHGFAPCGDYDSKEGTWGAVRRDNLNLMITHDPVFYERYKVAMEVCRALRLKHKQDRIAVCQIVRDGKTATEVVTSGQLIGVQGMAP